MWQLLSLLNVVVRVVVGFLAGVDVFNGIKKSQPMLKEKLQKVPE